MAARDPIPPAHGLGNVAAIIVTRGPVDTLSVMLQGLLGSVQRVVVVSNDDECPAPPDWARDRVQALWNGNRGGLAGAYNMALGVLPTDADGGPDKVVFLDQDSDVAALAPLLNDPEVRALFDRPDVAAVAPAYRERATGLRGRYIQLHRWSLMHMPREFSGARQVAFLINSMSVWQRRALQRIGPFNEALAVDHVDTEYCLRARAAALGLWVQGSVEFAHAIGVRRSYRLLGRVLQAGGHPPQRRWMIARNTVWLARRWCWREPAFAGLCLMRLGYEATGVLLAEDRKAAKLWGLFRGLCAGLVMRAQ